MQAYTWGQHPLVLVALVLRVDKAPEDIGGARVSTHMCVHVCVHRYTRKHVRVFARFARMAVHTHMHMHACSTRACAYMGTYNVHMYVGVWCVYLCACVPE